LGYPGGPVISKLAAQAVIPSPTGNPGSAARSLDSRFRGNDIHLPRPMIGTKDYDFSFSGLKTAVLYADRKITNKNTEYKKQMASEVQQAIIDVLIKKTIEAVRDFNAQSLILGGGVSANKELRKQFSEKLKKIVVVNLSFDKNATTIKLLVPDPNLSTDNALMTAITGFYHKKNTVNWKNISADGNLRISK
jgi:N6-L-threonylcarbamoyladenine synthase